MWLGESERMVRDLFAQARAKRKAGACRLFSSMKRNPSWARAAPCVPSTFPIRWYRCFAPKWTASSRLRDVVIILASNRPDLIDPAVLRPGRIDRKSRSARPDREAARGNLKVYLTDDLPLDAAVLAAHGGERRQGLPLAGRKGDRAIFRSVDSNRLLSVRLRSGQQKMLYRGDLVSGAILASIVQRAKEKAIERDRVSRTAQRPACTVEQDRVRCRDRGIPRRGDAAAGRCGGRMVEAARSPSRTGRRAFPPSAEGGRPKSGW